MSDRDYSNYWFEVSESDFPHEREGLAWIRDHLPAGFIAWSNFTFDADGVSNEVDCLIAGPTGVFHVELKSYKGALQIEGGSWRFRSSSGYKTIKGGNPRHLAEKKAKRLKSRLEQVSRRGTVPYITSLVFFHHATSDVSQAVELGEIGLVVSDGKSGSGPGLVETLRDPTIAGLRAPRNKYSKGQIADVKDRMQKIGIASRMASRSVGDYELQHLISSRDGSEDWIAIHRASDKDQDRVRCYPIPPACDEEKRGETRRRAKREWSLLRKLNHQNIETVLNYVPDGDRGPSLIYRGVPELILGDVFQKKIALNDEQIYSILRQLADAVSYAHSNGIYHRALSPESVSLHPRDDCFRVEVTRWLSAVDERNTTRHILPGDLELLGYRSMELLSDPGRSDPRVDIYSLGGIAFFLATGGHPPLSDAGRPLVTSKGLDAPDQLRDLSPELRRLIERSTAASEDRIRTVQDFVDLLDCFPKTQEEVPEAEQVVDPLQASPPASEIQFSNKRLLGSGSAGTAYLVNNADGEFVLKVANDPSCDYLLEQEADALRSISSPRVVQLHKDLKYEQRSAVLIDVAGKILLGELLRKSDLTTEQRQELILELLELAVDLEAAGIVHGDLHPGHIGVHNPPGDLRVCAFDFSLRPSGSSLPASIEYSDPREVVDPLADRYSIAAMCYQLYTGSLFTRTGLQTPNDTIASVLMDAMHEFVENRPASARAMRDGYKGALEKKLQDDACRLEDESASDFKMPIGKHKGKTLGEILEKHRGYLEWAVENIDDKPHITDKCKSLLAMSPSEPDQVHNGVDADPVRRWSLIDLKVTHPNPLRRSVPYDYTSGTRGSIRTMGGRCQRPYRCLISSPKLQTRLLRPVQQNIFCVVEKILTRGSFSPLSPNLESIVSRLVSEASTGDATTEAEIGCEFSFDSEHEADLYERFLKFWLSSDQMSCLISQVNIAGLTGNSADLPLGERVDFVLTDGEDVRVVVEVDGPQHVDDVSYDQTRDTRLQAAGWQVVRIPTSELKAGSGENLSFLRERCEACSPPTRLLLDDVFSRCLQVQLALLEVLRAKQPGDCLPVQIVWPEWEGIDAESLDAAVVDDFNQLTSQVAELYGSACTVVQHARHDPEVIVSFQGITDSMPEDCPTWTIRDIHIPGRYRPRLRSSTLQSELHPNKEMVQSLVQRIYGFSSLREGQYEAIERGLIGQDSIVLLPTGAGKSVVFQTVCLLRSGVGLVISPLISLMEDQIDNLHRHGITNCGFISADLDHSQKKEFVDHFSSGSLLLAYIAPERLQMEDFRSVVRSLCAQSPVSCVAIDEAHCVSEWGHSFRTSYLNLAENCRNLCSHKSVVPPLFALTGTASRSVLMDVQRELSINDPKAVITPSTFDREELLFSIRRCKSDDKQMTLGSAIREVAERFGRPADEFFEPQGDLSNCGLVFVPHSRHTYGVVDASKTVNKATTQECGMYAGKSPVGYDPDVWRDLKKVSAKRFKDNELTFLSATSAFGMGVDKPNVRCTFHINLPPSIETLYQEVGRAGRDREQSICTIIYSDEEARVNKALIDPNTPVEELAELSRGYKGDDIRRMLQLHTDNFQGERAEEEQVNITIDRLGPLDSPSTVTLSWRTGSRDPKEDGDAQKALEKCMHRLLTLSVVSDYTVAHSKKEIKVDVAGTSNDNVMRSLRSYMSNFDSREARMKIQELASRAELPRPEFAKLASKTLTGFIYQHIEKARRRSLIETLRLCEEGRTNESEFRKRLVEYLQTSKFSKQVDELCVSGPRDSSLDASDDQTDPGTLEKCAYVLGMIEDCGTPDDAGHLRGEAARALTSYPGNPHLLLLRALSECLVRSPSERSIQEDGDESVRVLSSMMAPDDLRKVLTDCSLAISNERPSSAHLFVETVCRARPDDCQYLESLVLADNDLLSVIAAKMMLSSINDRISNLVSSEP